MKLGPFRLVEPLGRGGMGEVWKGFHERQRIPVAVKVIAGERATSDRFRRAFADEVRAVARLDHPSIVSVFDHGVLPEELAFDHLVAGSPYLVMEHCNARSLRSLDCETYDELKATLLQLLDALAHAHARGVIHRDIKPGNVLLHRSNGVDARVKLTDFGIARAAGAGPVALPAGSSGTGTPGYMAPEQIVGDVMAQGPWTDLYAAGCLAFRLATGHVPYASAGDDNAVLAAHLREPVPPLDARFPVPVGFQGWIEKLLDKRPLRRFVRAADAIWALVQLGEPDDDLESGRDTLVDPIAASNDDATLTTLALLETDDLKADDWGVVGPSHDAPTCPIPGAGDAPPIPTSYERRVSTPPGLRLLGAGLGLYGLRPVPLIGRRAERGVIWEILRDVATTMRPSLVLLRGPTGQGKSRLAEWVVERAHELGSATVLQAHHAAVSSASHGLGPMLARYFGCTGVDRGAVLRHLRDQLGSKPPFDLLSVALTEIIHPRDPTTSSSTDAETSAVRFSNMEERYATVGQLLEQLSLTRPVILWLDDVQWGADALGLAEHLLGRSELRVLILATYRDDLTEGRPLEAARLRRLLQRQRAEVIAVGPLSPAEHRDLVRHLLGLESELAKQVEERTEGSPLFAVQLVGDWVRRGVLEVGKEGFRLRPGERAELPESLHALWAARVHQLVDTTSAPGSTLEALELAAALGERVHQQEWDELCAAVRVSIPADLAGRLVESGLGRPDPLGWAFCHGMFRESLEKTAADSGRTKEHHRACAAMLESRYAETPELSERLAHHRHLGGDLPGALDSYGRAVAYRFDRGDFDRVLQVLQLRQQVLDEGGVAPDDRRRIHDRCWRIRVMLAQGEYDAAGRELRAAEASARDHVDLATICQLHAELRWSKGQMTQARELAEGARQQFEALSDRGGAADCQRIAAKCLLEGSGERPQALNHARAAREAYQAIGDRDRLAECDYLEAKIHTELGDYGAAGAACLAAQTHHRAMGHRLGLAKCANQLGEIARLRGQLGEAEHHYLRAVELLEAMGSDQAAGVRLNLALVLIGRERYGRAMHELSRLQQRLARSGQDRAQAYVDYALLPCLAAEQAWLELDEQLDRAARWVPQTGRVDKDYAALAERAASLAEAQGERRHAMAPLRLALAHWEALGKQDRASLARRRLTALKTALES